MGSSSPGVAGPGAPKILCLDLGQAAGPAGGEVAVPRKPERGIGGGEVPSVKERQSEVGRNPSEYLAMARRARCERHDRERRAVPGGDVLHVPDGMPGVPPGETVLLVALVL